MGCLWGVSQNESSTCALCLPKFILLGSFTDTLLVVSIFDIVYDCNLQTLLQSWWFYSSCGNFGSLLTWGWAFPDCGGVWAVSKVESLTRACASLSEVYPAGKFQWHFTCGFDFRQSMVAICGRFCSPEGVKGNLLRLDIVFSYYV